jgi:hypothetical protein
MSAGLSILTNTFNAAFFKVEEPLKALRRLNACSSTKATVPCLFFRHLTNHGCAKAYSPVALLLVLKQIIF